MLIKKFIKSLRLKIFNYKNCTQIHSLSASLNANYGKNVRVDESSYIADDVSIGKYTYVNHSSSIENCNIGSYCSISSGVYISPYEHILTEISTHPKFEPIEHKMRKRKKVEIGNDVLISLNVIILEGVNIGTGAVIGAGAVVTKDVQPYEIVAGVPAHNIGYRFSKEKIDRLLSSKWWESDQIT